MNPGLLIPEYIVLAVATVVLSLDFLLKEGKKQALPWIAVAGLVGALGSAIMSLGTNGSSFGGAFLSDGFTDFFRIIILGVGALVVMASISTFSGRNHEGVYYTLMLFAMSGAMLMAGAGEMITLYLAIELLSLPAYALVAFRKQTEKANDAVLKYFVLGILASAMILYALSMAYGMTGMTDIASVASALIGTSAEPLVIVTSVLFLAGLGFKVAAVPFHWWAPDAYEGAPAQVSAFLASISKAAAFAAVIRIFVGAFIDTAAAWEVWFGVIAAVTMVVGTLLALPQTNLKRLLAYSSISHAGFILMGFAVASKLGIETVLFYVLVYAAATVGSFFVVVAASKHAEAEEISDLAGLSQRSPALALVMVIFLLSLLGIPPLAGFVGKLYLLGAVVDAGMLWLAVVAAVATIASAGYYLKVIREMYLVDPNETEVAFTPTLKIASYAAVAMVIVLGVYSGPFVNLARTAARSVGLGS